jgi:hypothetical protein
MSAIAFPSGTRVQAILLDEGRTELPGMVGMVVPVSEWPASFPEAWTEENTVIVRWDAEDGRKPFTPYRSDVANRVLRVLAAPAPTDPSTGAVTQPNPAPVDDTTPSLVMLDRDAAAQHLANAASVFLMLPGVRAAHREGYDALRQALADYRETAS